MRQLIFALIFILAAGGCSKDEEKTTPDLSEQDQSAIEAMEDWLGKAQSYNDSLEMCCGSEVECADSMHQHYDDMLHKCEERFQHHHEQFEHNRDHGDHFHENGNHQMGTMYQNNNMGHHHNSNDDHQGRLGHRNREHEDMHQIMESHCHNP